MLPKHHSQRSCCRHLGFHGPWPTALARSSSEVPSLHCELWGPPLHRFYRRVQNGPRRPFVESKPSLSDATLCKQGKSHKATYQSSPSNNLCSAKIRVCEPFFSAQGQFPSASKTDRMATFRFRRVNQFGPEKCSPKQ